jgi:hypothetical protein
MPSLRQIILRETGLDLRRCQNCAQCEAALRRALTQPANVTPSPPLTPGPSPSVGYNGGRGENWDGDIPIESVIHLVMLDDEEVLTARTVWSDSIQQASRYACQRGLDLARVLAALRDEARRRGMMEDG